jgi:hypothetical protein
MFVEKIGAVNQKTERSPGRQHQQGQYVCREENQTAKPENKRSLDGSTRRTT